MPKYPRYQDYVIRDGRLVGEFEQMYRDHADPWEQTTRESFASEKAVALNLLEMLREGANARRVVELGCGLGHFTAKIAAKGFDITGVDVSPTAIEKARKSYPHVCFQVADIADHDALKALQPDVIVMAEITWYVLEQLGTFLSFLRTSLPNTFVLHLLNFYPAGVQKHGVEFFTDLQGALKHFGMEYLESGEVHRADGMTRSWFLGRWPA